MKIVAIGRTNLLYDSIMCLMDEGHTIAGIITAKAAPEYTVSEHDFAMLAQEIQCPYHCLQNDRTELQQCLEQFREADIGISVNWPYILTAADLNIFQNGILNAHAGDLPQFRGNACPNWAIISGQSEVWISIHCMTPGLLDCGKVIAQDKMNLSDETIIGDIYRWLETVTPALFCTAISKLEQKPDFMLKYASPQDPQGFRCYPRTPQDSRIRWEESAENIHRLIRASSAPFAGAYTYIIEKEKLQRLYIEHANLICRETSDMASPGSVLANNRKTGHTKVMCGQGVIEITKCRLNNGKTFAPGAYFSSIRMRLGVCLEDYLWEKEYKDL